MKLPELKKTYEKKTVLDIPSIGLESGLIYAVLGSNGSGKSTLAKLLAGVIRPDSGVTPLNKTCCVGYLPQKPFAFRMSVESNLRLADKNEENVRRQLGAFNLTQLKKQSGAKLSGGEAARMALARLLLRNAELLILDEPTASMDAGSTLTAEQQILEYRERNNCCVLLITHSVSQAERLADRVMIFDSGKLIESGVTADVLSNPSRDETKRFLEFCGR